MSDKLIVLCVVLAAVAIIAIVFIRRAMRYKKALGACVPEKEVIPEAETQPEPPPAEPSATGVYLNRFVYPRHRSSTGGRSVNIHADHHARIKLILNRIGRYGISVSRYIDGVLTAHFEDNAEVIERLFGKLPNEPHQEKR